MEREGILCPAECGTHNNRADAIRKKCQLKFLQLLFLIVIFTNYDF
jgi:hypothetical protein